MRIEKTGFQSERNPTKLRVPLRPGAPVPTPISFCDCNRAPVYARVPGGWCPEGPLDSASTPDPVSRCAVRKRPNSMLRQHETPIVNAVTRQSSAARTTAVPGPRRSNPRNAGRRPRPSMPPHPATGTLSVSNWRTTCSTIGTHRRTDGQLALTPPPSSRFATLRTRDQARAPRRRTAPTTPFSTSPVVASRIGTTATPSSEFRVGLASCSRRIVHSVLRAATVTSGFSRPGGIENGPYRTFVCCKRKLFPFGSRLKAPREGCSRTV